ncbi:hypothetical protein [Laribacter hongkongensis]|uniref:hypothetical protein n=1 Tax=Laribacter hongkongensis TaxID=168471 RepID=UPI001EFD0DEE|nr:hypothetical protein [Laribacter hongkongensis]MCG9078959.1 hypothetical protein [Laribacter hongkongensis]
MNTQQTAADTGSDDPHFRMQCTEMAIGVILKHLAKHQGIDMQPILDAARNEVLAMRGNDELTCRTSGIIDRIAGNARN